PRLGLKIEKIAEHAHIKQIETRFVEKFHWDLFFYDNDLLRSKLNWHLNGYTPMAQLAHNLRGTGA
ncbi:Hypothetical protein CINCED_3A011490, partial [Cinara cedri]